MSIDLWRKREYFKLSEAALLLAGHNPDKFNDADLLTKPPEGFKAIYGAMLSDAVAVIEKHVQSEEDPDCYYTLYRLMTDKPENSEKLTDSDGFTVRVDAITLKNWATEVGFDLGLLASSIEIDKTERGLHPKERKTMLRTIAALKDLILAKPDYFKTQTDLIAHLDREYKSYGGLSRTKLEETFAEANRVMQDS